MTPKEEAKRIVNLMYFTISNNGSYTGENSMPNKFKEAKKCASIAIDEITKEINSLGFSEPYWDQVKQEIEKL
jgi:hypothetical protein